MKTRNFESERSVKTKYGSLSIKKSTYWNVRRRYMSKGHFEIAKYVK